MSNSSAPQLTQKRLYLSDILLFISSRPQLPNIILALLVAAAKVADDDNDVYTVRGGEAPSGCVDIYYLRRSISDAGRQGKEDAWSALPK